MLLPPEAQMLEFGANPRRREKIATAADCRCDSHITDSCLGSPSISSLEVDSIGGYKSEHGLEPYLGRSWAV